MAKQGRYLPDPFLFVCLFVSILRKGFNMAPHQQRVVEEKEQLDGLLERLGAFLLTELFASLPEPEKGRLRNQHYHMREYSDILSQRIAAF